MTQERLKGLTLLNIEASPAKVMETDTLIDTLPGRRPGKQGPRSQSSGRG